MNEEIKKINIPENVLVALGDLTNGTLNYYKATETVKVRHNTILDYITNLQEENERLKDELEQNKNPLRGIFAQVTDDDLLRNNAAMYAELEDYKSRCEKANNILKDTNVDKTLLIETIDYARHILNGGDEE